MKRLLYGFCGVAAIWGGLCSFDTPLVALFTIAVGVVFLMLAIGSSGSKSSQSSGSSTSQSTNRTAQTGNTTAKTAANTSAKATTNSTVNTQTNTKTNTNTQTKTTAAEPGFCKNCGKPLDPGAIFCGYCGWKCK